MLLHRTAIFTLFFAAFGIGACAGVPSTIESAYGNTLMATMPNGRVARYYFDPDGTYMLETGAGTLVRGQYEVEGDQICRTPTGGERACAHFAPNMRVGQSWRQTTADGMQYEVTLLPGRTHLGEADAETQAP